jgi:hypothetical protein
VTIVTAMLLDDVQAWPHQVVDTQNRIIRDLGRKLADDRLQETGQWKIPACWSSQIAQNLGTVQRVRMALAPYLKPCFTVPFICPKGQAGLRHYHVQALQEYWSECTPTSFLEEACNCEYQIVKRLEKHSKDQEKLYHAHLALLRNRQAGYVSIKRQFKTAVDFLDMSSPREPRLIVPGLEPQNPLPNSLKRTPHSTARWMLGNALRHDPPDSTVSKEFLAKVRACQEIAFTHAISWHNL